MYKNDYMYAVERNGEYLEHYGVKGMKWGVRKLIDRNGQLANKGLKRYGDNGKRSARGMQRDYNKLDQSYANVSANLSAAREKLNRAKKMQNYGKIDKAKSQISEHEKQLKGIESVQNRITNKAKAKGYTVSAQKKQRVGVSTGAKTAAAVGGIAGGSIGAAIGMIGNSALNRGRNTAVVNGSKVKIRKRGNGSSNTIRYNGKQHQTVDQFKKTRNRSNRYYR